MQPDLILVIPCFNEARRIDRAAFRDFLQHNPDARLLFVDDGSTDGTREVLAAMERDHAPRAALLALERNRGKAEAVRAGLLHALERGARLTGWFDADLATPLSAVADLRGLLDRHPQVQIAIGSRVRLLGRDIQRHAWRHYTGRVFATAASLVCRLPVYDTQCGAKLLRATPDVRAILEQPFRSRWVFDVELLTRFERRLSAMGRRAEDECHELPLEAWRDVPGSKLRLRDVPVAAVHLMRLFLRYPPVKPPAPTP